MVVKSWIEAREHIIKKYPDAKSVPVAAFGIAYNWYASEKDYGTVIAEQRYIDGSDKYELKFIGKSKS